MLKWFRDLFSETSDVSMGRFMSLLSVLSAVLIALVSVFADRDLNAATMLCSAFLAAGFTGKVMQRSIESKEQIEEKSEPVEERKERVQRGSKWKK